MSERGADSEATQQPDYMKEREVGNRQPADTRRNPGFWKPVRGPPCDRCGVLLVALSQCLTSGIPKTTASLMTDTVAELGDRVALIGEARGGIFRSKHCPVVTDALAGGV